MEPTGNHADFDASTSPPWFDGAIGTAPDEASLTVDGATIHYLRWGQPGRPGIVLIHGGAAHAHWWSHLAPQLLPDYTVVALDLSGHGDSDHRDGYAMDVWAGEVMAVADDAGIVEPPILVGHSMGGFVALGTAAKYPDALRGIVIIDSPVTDEDPEVAAGRRGRDFANPRIYESIDEAVARFRTVPAQANYLPYVMDYIGRRSLRPIDTGPDGGGFTWKFDPRVFETVERRVAAAYLPLINCRVALLRAEHGLVTPDIGQFMYDQLGRVAPVIVLPEAGHHPMLDVPLVLLTALRSLIADWEHSVPLSRR